MTYLKALIGLTLGFIGVVLLLMLATFDTDHELRLAEESFLKGEYSDAESRLNRIAQEIPKERLMLYKAYLLRQQGDLSASSKDLEDAFSHWSNGESYSRLGLEIAINRALNAYLSESDQELTQSLQQMKGLPLRSQEWEEFFSGLLAMQQNQCQEALRQWRSLRDLPSFSRWMQRGVVDLFPESRKNLQQVYCLIEVGEISTARFKLDALKKQVLSPEQLEDAEFLLGKSYLVDAASRPIATRGAYYKSAFEILARVPLQSSRYKKERAEILKQVENTAEGLIIKGNLQELPFYAAILQNWNAQGSLHKIASQMMAQIESSLLKNDSNTLRTVVVNLNRLLPEGVVRKQLSEELEKKLFESIQNGDQRQTSLVFDAAIAFEGDAVPFRKRVLEHLEQEIFKVVKSDNAFLTTTITLLNFWEQIATQEQQRMGMARELMSALQEVWKQGEEDKALKMMLLAAKMVPWNERDSFKKELELVLQRFYALALQQKRVTVLPSIQRSASEFELKELSFNQPQDIAFLMDEASYLSVNGRVDEAKDLLDWILTIAPEHTQAVTLAGILAYRAGDYVAAEKFLRQLKTLPKEVVEPFVVSKLVNSPLDRREDWERFIQKNIPTPEAYLRLAVEAFKANRKDESIGWLQMVNPNSIEAKLVAARIYQQSTKGLIPEGYIIPSYLKQ